MAIKKEAGAFYVTYSLQGKRFRKNVGQDLGSAIHFMRSIGKPPLPEQTAVASWHAPKTFEDGIKKFWALHGQYMPGKVSLKPLIVALGPVPIPEVPRHLQAVYDSWRLRYRAHSANRLLSSVYRILNRLREWGDWDGPDPVRTVKRVLAEPVPISQAEIDQVLVGCRDADPALYGVILCMLDAGLRVSETLALRWEDVDLPARTMKVLQAKVRVVQTVALSPRLADFFAGRSARPGPVFTFAERTLHERFKKAVVRLGLRLRLWDFRLAWLRQRGQRG